MGFDDKIDVLGKCFVCSVMHCLRRSLLATSLPPESFNAQQLLNRMFAFSDCNFRDCLYQAISFSFEYECGDFPLIHDKCITKSAIRFGFAFYNTSKQIDSHLYELFLLLRRQEILHIISRNQNCLMHFHKSHNWQNLHNISTTIHNSLLL